MNIFSRKPKAEYANKLTVTLSGKELEDILSGVYDLVVITHPESFNEYHLNPKFIPSRCVKAANRKAFEGFTFSYVAIYEQEQKGKPYIPGVTNG